MTSPGLVAADGRPLGDGDGEVLAAGPVALLARAVGARGRLAVRVVAEGEERGDVPVGPQPDVAALAAVAAVGTAARDVRLAPERHAAGSAVAAAHVQLRLVDEPLPPLPLSCAQAIAEPRI